MCLIGVKSVGKIPRFRFSVGDLFPSPVLEVVVSNPRLNINRHNQAFTFHTYPPKSDSYTYFSDISSDLVSVTIPLQVSSFVLELKGGRKNGIT